MLDREGVAGPEGIAMTARSPRSSSASWRWPIAGVTEFAAVEFPGNPDEAAATRSAIKLAMA